MLYKHFSLISALVGITATLLISQNTNAIVNGNAVTAQEQQDRGLVSIGTNCSGVLIANDWVMTAGHCVAANRVQPTNVTFTLNGVNSVADAIYLFGGFADEVGPDLALVHLSTPLVVNGSNTGFVNRLWPGDPSSLINPTRIVAVYGQGVNACAGGGAGVYRAADLEIDAINRAATERPINPTNPPTTFVNREGGHYHRLIRNSSNQITAPGDSGGPGFIWQEGIPYIVGVNSSSDCPGGNAHQVSIPAVREWVGAVFKTQWSPLATSQPVWVLPPEVDGTKWSVQDVNAVGWAQSARAAAAMCYNRGFAGGHFDGHQGVQNGNQGLGIQCSSGNALWRDVTAAQIGATGWGFADVNAVSWAQANRAAERLCAGFNQGFAGGHFNGHMRNGNYGLFCYKDGAQWFDGTDAEIAATGFGFPTPRLDDVLWAQAARAATGFCRGKGFSGGFMNGHQGPGKYGVVCQK